MFGMMLSERYFDEGITAYLLKNSMIFLKWGLSTVWKDFKSQAM